MSEGIAVMPTGETNSISDFVAANLEDGVRDLLDRLFPLCRSITGDGVRGTSDILREVVDFEVHEVASGTECYDWTVPDQWNIRDAFVEDVESDRRLIDFRANNLHVVNYSEPIDAILSFHRSQARPYPECRQLRLSQFPNL